MKRITLICALTFSLPSLAQNYTAEQRLLSPVRPAIPLSQLDANSAAQANSSAPTNTAFPSPRSSSKAALPTDWPPTEENIPASISSARNVPPSQPTAPTYMPAPAPEATTNYPPLKNVLPPSQNSYAPPPSAAPQPNPAYSYAPPPAGYGYTPPTQETRYIDDVRKRSREFDRQETYHDKMRLSFGAGLGYRPKFEGSDSYRVWPIPVVDVSYADTFFINTFRGMGYNLFNSPDFKAGPLLTFDWGRDSGDAAYLRGFKDIKPTLESGFFMDKKITKNIGVNWDLKNDFLDHGHGGITSSLGLDGSIPLSSQLSGMAGIKTTWASSSYMESYFGVSPAQSATSGLATYKAKSGFKDMGGDVGLSYQMNERLAFAVSIGLKRLIGDAANSPITQHGARDQWFGGSYVTYTF